MHQQLFIFPASCLFLSVLSLPATAINLVRYDFNFRVPVGFQAASGEVGTGYVVYDADLAPELSLGGSEYATTSRVSDADRPDYFPYTELFRTGSSLVATEFQVDFLGRRFTSQDNTYGNDFSGYTPAPVSIQTKRDGTFCGVNFSLNRPQLAFHILPDCEPEINDNFDRLMKPNFVNFYRGTEFYITGTPRYQFDASNVVNYTLVTPPPAPVPEPTPIPTPEPTPVPVPEEPTPTPTPVPEEPTPTPTPVPEPTPTPTPVPEPTPTPEPTTKVPEPGLVLALLMCCGLAFCKPIAR
jgi:hypothetical protein